MESKFDYKDTNIIMIGIKPFMNYVTAVKMQFDKGDEIFVIARGKFISKAFDVIEVYKRNFMKDFILEYAEIKVDSQAFINQDNKEIYVSTIEIKLIQKKK